MCAIQCNLVSCSVPCPAFVVPASLRQKVADGKLGRKSGEGFCIWDGDKLAGYV